MVKMLAIAAALGGILAGCAKTQIGYNPETRQFSYSSEKNILVRYQEETTSGTIALEIRGDAATVNEGTWQMVNTATGQVIPIAAAAAGVP